MDKRLVFLVAFFVAGFMLFGCLEYINGGRTVPGVHKINQTGNATNQTVVNETNQTAIVTPKACEDLTVGKEDCIIERAFNNNRYSDCQKLNGSEYTRCVYKLAEISYSNCLRFTNSEDADNCLLNMTSKYGAVVCKNVVNQTKKDDCGVLSVSPDCRSITEVDERFGCDAIAKNNESVCEESVDETGHDSCYLEFSQKKRDVCAQIDNEGIRAACNGLLKNNTSPCSAITSASLIRDNCYKTYAEESADCSVCNSVVDSVYKDNCFVDCAVENSNPSVCAESDNEQKADSCYWQYAVKAGNVSACNPIKLISLKRVCVEEVAKKEGKPNDCEMLLGTYGLTQGDVSFCYLNVIATTNVTFENCRMMNDGYYEDTCISNAIKRDNLSRDYCAYIMDDTLKATCFKS